MLTDVELGAECLKYIVAAGDAKSNNAKLSILMEAKRDHEVRSPLFEFLRLVKDPGFNYYMTAKRIPDPQAQGSGPSPFAPNMIGLILLLNSLYRREWTGQAAENMVAHWLHHADTTHRWLFKMAIERSLPGNVGRTLLNKVHAGLIYKQPYGGCKSYDADMIHKRFSWSTPGATVWQTKEDGMTLLVDIQTKQIRTRAGQDVSVQLGPYLKPIFNIFPTGFVCHFEAKYLDDLYEPMPRPTANGHYNALFKTGRAMDPERMSLVLLDIVPRNEFYGKCKPTMMLVTRISHQESAVCDYIVAKNDMVTGWPHVQAVSWYPADNIATARQLTQQEISFGGEGGILKRADGTWKSGKMVSQMKMKNEFETTLLVIGWKAHKKQAGWVGSLLCVSDDNEISTYVGSGLNEKDGDPLDRRQGYDAFHGQLMEIRAEKISTHNALDLPRLIEPRLDKSRADTGEEVKAAYADSTSLASNPLPC